VINTGRKAGEIARNQIQLDLIECSGAGRRTKIDFAAGILPVPGNAGG